MAALLLILSLTVHTVKSGSHVIVRPTDSDSSICGDHADATVLCYTLSHLISSEPAFITDGSDLELKFMRGTHSTTVSKREWMLEGKKNVTWHGQNAEIVCKKPFVFSFIEIKKLVIKNLTFSKCGSRISFASLKSRNAAIFLTNIFTLHFNTVAVINSTGYGLFGLNFKKEASFAFCQFIDNNRGCNSGNDCCIGGNIALNMSNISSSLQISINSSVIKGGIDGSRKRSSCVENALPLSRANGLTVVYHHTEHLVQLSINNCSFVRNSGNNHYPAVLVYDDTGLRNNLTIINSTFKEEGTLVISNIDNPMCKEKSICYAAQHGSPKSTVLASITNCTFLDGTQSGLEIYVSPTHVRNKRFGVITIKDSQFRDYKGHSDKAVVKITYKYSKVEFAAVRIKVQDCIFEFNKILSLSVHLNRDTYLYGAKKIYINAPIVTLASISFINNEHSAVFIAVKHRSIPVWQSPVDENNQIICIVDIINCCFTKNKIANISKGVLEVRKAYIGLKAINFSSSSGTALYAEESVIRFEDQNLFTQNRGHFGGALDLNKSMLFLMPFSHIHITNNTASSRGGGVFAISQCGINTKKCKHKMKNCICTVNKHIEARDTELITLTGNKANLVGSSLFGGKYSNCISLYNNNDNCTFIPEESNRPIPRFIKYSSDISSPATKLCLCDNNSLPTDQCSNVTREVFPGETFQIPIVVMGELHDKTSAVITATIHKEKKLDRFVGIGYGQQIQLLETKNCTNISYRINSDSRQETLELAIDEWGFPPKVFLSDVEVIQPFLVNVILKDCPKGYNLSNKTEGAPECKCEDILNNNSNIECDINEGITIKGNMWIGLINNTNHNEIVIYENCPFDYCNCTSENCLKSIAVESPEKQCNYNRSGTLCGACRNGYSSVLGSSNCVEKCSNVYLLLIIPFALAGVALVVLLLKCNLTVSVGHINGIIFYANIVQVNKAILFPNHKVPYQIFSTFIAWLNLDLDVETCFFEHMDSYAKVWLQFVFPVYVWIIIALIIVLANYSPKLGTLIGNNAVPVLATLFFLSYAKLLRTIIAATAFTFIVFKDDSYITVWLRDGNVKYFDPKHIVLFIVALLFISLYILPLTLLVLLAPCLQARSHHKAFRWVNRLKPFLDAYQGPYSDKFRFWTGLLLILRIVLFIIDASNYGNDPSMSFFCTIGVIIPLAMVLVKTGVYRHTLANCIELLSLLNLMILFAVSWLTTTTGYLKWHPIREYATYISVAVTMLAFIGIILYQLIVAIYPTLIMVVYPKVFDRRDKSTEQTTGETAHAVSVEPPTSTTVELQECDQLREPLLETN